MDIEYWNSKIANYNISAEDRNSLQSFFELLKESQNSKEYELRRINKAELSHIFDIVKFNPKFQIEIWRALPDEITNNAQNSEIFEDVLGNKFGEYIRGIDKKALVELLNGSKEPNGAMDSNGKMLYWNESLLSQMNSPLFENPIAREAFSFEQLLEIVSIRNTERSLESILLREGSKDVLMNIGKDIQNWQAKLQYLMDSFVKMRDGLGCDEYDRLTSEFEFDGEKLIYKELERRKNLFTAMERGYFEDVESGELFECEFNNILRATFGIDYEEAQELIKKYGVDIDKLNIQTDEEKRIHRKLQIIKELTVLKKDGREEDFENYYYSHKKELLEISKDVSVFYKVDLEQSFLDLYARQYDRALGVETTRLKDISYEGKDIPVYEVSGDFNLLIREEQGISPAKTQNFWNSTQIHLKGSCNAMIGQDYIRPVTYNEADACFVASVSCKDGELRMASTTNIKSKGANVQLSNLGVKSDFGNGVVFRTPQEQKNNSRGSTNETIIARNIYNSETGLCERKDSDYVVYIQETNDTNIEQDPRFKTAQFVASQTGWPILIIPREKCAEREDAKIRELKDKLLGSAERSSGETDESIIRDLIVKFNNNREGILTSETLREKYFTEGEHIELVGMINARLSQVKANNPTQYESLVQTVSEIYNAEIGKYYAFSYDRDDVQLDIDVTREHLKPYEDFLLEHERNKFDLSSDEKKNIYGVMKKISQTAYYDMNKYHSLSHIQKVVMFSGLLAKNENLDPEETTILLAAAAFHDSGRHGAEGENDNHAVASAKQVMEYFENEANNPFGITAENISMIQAVIEYHEHKEREKGVTDEEKLHQLCYEYNIDIEMFDSLKKVSELLKDADALDRARFGKKNENRWSLDSKYLKSDTAKSISMLRFSEGCNFEFKAREAQEEHGEAPVTLSENTVEEIFENELSEFSRPKIQMSSIKQMTSEVTEEQKGKMVSVFGNIRRMVKRVIENIKGQGGNHDEI